MKVKIEDLQEGCIIAENIMGLTSNPLMLKNTVLTPLHIEVLKAFQINYAGVFSKKEDGSKFNAEAVEESLINENQEREENEDMNSLSLTESNPIAFEKSYETAVSYFRHEFNAWQSGSKVDVVSLKQAVLPVIQFAMADRKYVYRLHQLSEPKDYMAHHSVAVGIISSMLAKKIGCDQGLCIQIGLAGVLADAGMAKMPLSLLKKSTALTTEEAIEIRKHPVYSYQYIMDTPFLKKEMKQAIYQHHERLDGSGYPKGEKGKNINLYAQIIALADVYHAMTSERLYRSKQSPFKTLDIILEDDFGKFDIVAVKALQELIGNLVTGTHVELSDGSQAEVIYTQSDYLTRPVVKKKSTNEIIDLTRQRKLYIEQVL